MALQNVEKSDVVLFFGSPHSGKTIYCCMHLLHTHRRICPEEIFRENPDCSLRQLILEYVVAELKNERRVVIDDDNWSYTKRDSFLSLIQRKISKCNFLCVNFHARYGKEQILFSREYQLAEAQEMHISVEHVNMGTSDALIDIWVKFESNREIGLTNLPTPDKPRESEGYTLKDIHLELLAQSKYQFEVPGLFIQWEGIAKAAKDEHVKLPTHATKTLNMWFNHNPCGRIIIIWDGSTTAFGGAAEREGQIKYLLNEISKELERSVIYLLHIEDNSLSGCFTNPPNSGILAYLQRLHLIDFNHRGSMYLYQSNNHQKMAEKVGLKHIRASRVFEHPHLVVSGHGCTKSTTPEMLINMKVVSPEESNRQKRSPEIPLYEETKVSTHNIVLCQTPKGRSLYIAYKNKDVLERYNKEYSDNASEIGSGESKLAKPVIETQQTEIMEEPSASTSGHRKHVRKRLSSGEKGRNVPEWMYKRSKKEKTPSSLLPSDSSEESLRSSGTKKKPSMESKTSRTIYIMSEAELVETAIDVLEEAGRPIPQIGGGEQHRRESNIISEAKIHGTGDTSNVASEKDRPASGQTERTRDTNDKSSSGDSSHDRILQDLFGFNEGDGSRVKAPPRKRISKDETQKCSGQDSSDEDKGDTEALLDELLGSGKNPSHRRAAPSARARANESDVFRVPDTSSSEEHRRQSLHKLSSAEVSDSFVEETSSSRSRSSKTSLVIPGSFVSDTPSSRSGSSKTSLIVHDSFVSDTPSSRSGSSKTSLIVHDSFVSDTSSSKSKSLKPSIVVPNSFVSESSSMRSSRNSRSSASTVPDSFVKDSPSQRSKRLSSSSVMDICIQETPSNGSNRSNSVDSKGSSSFRVPETVTTVPETAMELHSYKT